MTTYAPVEDLSSARPGGAPLPIASAQDAQPHAALLPLVVQLKELTSSLAASEASASSSLSLEDLEGLKSSLDGSVARLLSAGSRQELGTATLQLIGQINRTAQALASTPTEEPAAPSSSSSSNSLLNALIMISQAAGIVQIATSKSAAVRAGFTNQSGEATSRLAYQSYVNVCNEMDQQENASRWQKILKDVAIALSCAIVLVAAIGFCLTGVGASFVILGLTGVFMATGGLKWCTDELAQGLEVVATQIETAVFKAQGYSDAEIDSKVAANEGKLDDICQAISQVIMIVGMTVLTMGLAAGADALVAAKGTARALTSAVGDTLATKGSSYVKLGLMVGTQTFVADNPINNIFAAIYSDKEQPESMKRLQEALVIITDLVALALCLGAGFSLAKGTMSSAARSSTTQLGSAIETLFRGIAPDFQLYKLLKLTLLLQGLFSLGQAGASGAQGGISIWQGNITEEMAANKAAQDFLGVLGTLSQQLSKQQMDMAQELQESLMTAILDFQRSVADPGETVANIILKTG